MSSPLAKFRGLGARDAGTPTVTLARRLGVVALVAAACRKPADISWHQETAYRWRALDVAARGAPGFAPLVARQTGLTHVNQVDDEHALANRNLLIGAGVALGDVDEDGLPDVFLASVERPAALYHNAGDVHFTDITSGERDPDGQPRHLERDVRGCRRGRPSPICSSER